MGEQRNLNNKEGIDKLKELAMAADICMFASHLNGSPISVRPMSTRDVDEEGNIWFFSRETSEKNDEIKADNRVQLFYANNSSFEYLSVFGHAHIIKDAAMAKELWSTWTKAWFKDGPEDPELTLIKIVPENVFYWDTKNNKMVGLLKMAASVITGTQVDDGVYGTINI